MVIKEKTSLSEDLEVDVPVTFQLECIVFENSDLDDNIHYIKKG